MIELYSINEVLEKCIYKKGISILVLSNSASNYYTLTQIAKTYTKFSYYSIDKSDLAFSSFVETMQLSFGESEIILLNGQKGWYVPLAGKNTNEVLKVISEVMTGGNVVKEKLDLDIINLISKMRKDEL